MIADLRAIDAKRMYVKAQNDPSMVASAIDSP